MKKTIQGKQQKFLYQKL